MARHVLAEVEERHGAPIGAILKGLMEEGLNKQSASERLGVTKNTLLRWIKKCNIDWPIYTLEHSRKRQNNLRERSLYHVEHNGETKPLFDAAKEEGIPYNVVLDRYKRGERGSRLFRPVREYHKPPGSYEINFTPEDWNLACELAEEIGTKRAAQKLNIPMSALTLARNGLLETTAPRAE